MEKLLTPEDVAELFAITKETVKKLARTGELKSIRLGKSDAYRFQQSDLEDYIAEQRKKPFISKVIGKKVEVSEVEPVVEEKPVITEVKAKKSIISKIAPETNSRILELLSENKTVPEIAVMLNEEGITTAKGLQWEKGNLSKHISRNLKGAKESEKEEVSNDNDEIPMP